MFDNPSRSRRNSVRNCAGIFAILCSVFGLIPFVGGKPVEAQQPPAKKPFGKPNQAGAGVFNQSMTMQQGFGPGKFQFFAQPFAPQKAQPLSAEEQKLLDSLQKQAVEIDLYRPQAKIARSFAWVTKSLDPALRQQRQIAFKNRQQTMAALASAIASGDPQRSFNQGVITPEGMTMTYRILPPLSFAKSRYEHDSSLKHPLATWHLKRPDLEGLPLEIKDSVRLKFDAAETLREHSTAFLAFKLFPQSSESLILEQLNQKAWNAADVPSLVQILQAGTEKVRLEYVAILEGIKTPRATEALVKRAVFDVSPDVRSRSIAALSTRSMLEVEPELLKGFEHPWRPAAKHAAEALAELKIHSAVPKLQGLLAKADPAAPFQRGDGTWAVRELARVNHLRNCFLCHAPSLKGDDLIRGLVPDPSQPLQLEYYRAATGYYVRADVTYLRQDFSVTHDVPNHKVWPEQQRFDYFVRTKPLSEKDAKKQLAQWDSAEYRKAVKYALDRLAHK